MSGAVRAGTLAGLKQRGCLVVQGGRHGIAVFLHDGRPHAVDNRCPHLGFPLARGTVKEGILTCHWHHWRFDLATGGCFTPGGDDVRVYPAWEKDGEVWVDASVRESREEALALGRADLQRGLQQSNTLGSAKSILRILKHGGTRGDVLRAAASFGASYRADWSTGMTVLTAMANLLEDVELSREGEVLALVHGAREVAASCEDRAATRPRQPLPGEGPPEDRLEPWFRMFVEEREEAGAERVLRTAVESGWDERRVAGMVFAAATDHLFLDDGHAIDYAAKAFELLRQLGWDRAGEILPLLVAPLCRAKRYEEDTEWCYPFDFVERLRESFDALPRRIEEGRGRAWKGEAELVSRLQSETPGEAIDALDEGLANGATVEALGRALAVAASYRLARYALRNEVFDWDTMHHAFTTANAVYQAAKFASPEAVVRGIYHGAVKVYLVRFLTIPPARLPSEVERGAVADPLAAMDAAVSTKRIPDAAAALDAAWRQGRPDAVKRALVEALLREDAGFHDFQSVEAALRISRDLAGDDATVPLVGAVRFLAAHCPTERFVSSTVDKAVRLERGEDLAADAER